MLEWSFTIKPQSEFKYIGIVIARSSNSLKKRCLLKIILHIKIDPLIVFLIKLQWIFIVSNRSHDSLTVVCPGIYHSTYMNELRILKKRYNIKCQNCISNIQKELIKEHHLWVEHERSKQDST